VKLPTHTEYVLLALLHPVKSETYCSEPLPNKTGWRVGQNLRAAYERCMKRRLRRFDATMLRLHQRGLVDWTVGEDEDGGYVHYRLSPTGHVVVNEGWYDPPWSVKLRVFADVYRNHIVVWVTVVILVVAIAIRLLRRLP
jgi:hypothetical protein